MHDVVRNSFTNISISNRCQEEILMLAKGTDDGKLTTIHDHIILGHLESEKDDRKTNTVKEPRRAGQGASGENVLVRDKA